MFIKQSTAYTFRLGPFVDDSDGKTAETGLTISQADVRLSKAGGNFAQKNESSSASHDEIGFYICILDTTDTNTCGELLVAVHESGALPVFKTFQVVEEAIYASLFAASADLITKIDAIDTVVDAVLVDTGTTLDGKLDTIDNFLDTEVAAILADTNELQGDWVNGGRLDLLVDSIISKVDVIDGIVDSILVDTAVIGSAGAGLTAVPWNAAWDAEVQSECTDALNAYDPPTKAEVDGTWTTAQTESYASDGAAATPAQLLYMIYTCVAEFAVSGTTLTAKKVDGSTTAMTFTLNDASDPTSRTRAS